MHACCRRVLSPTSAPALHRLQAPYSATYGGRAMAPSCLISPHLQTSCPFASPLASTASSPKNMQPQRCAADSDHDIHTKPSIRATYSRSRLATAAGSTAFAVAFCHLVASRRRGCASQWSPVSSHPPCGSISCTRYTADTCTSIDHPNAPDPASAGRALWCLWRGRWASLAPRHAGQPPSRRVSRHLCSTTCIGNRARTRPPVRDT